MIKTLVSFGCSWPHGTELENPDTDAYPALIAQHYGWALNDYTQVKTTLPEMLADFNNWLAITELDDPLVLINLTREDMAGPLSNLPSKLTYKVLTDKNINGNLTVEDQVFEWAVHEFNNIAEAAGVNMLQFNVLARQHRMKLPTLIESSSALEMLVIRNKPRKDPLFAEYKHPNEKGHAIISEFLIDKIDSVIINE